MAPLNYLDKNIYFYFLLKVLLQIKPASWGKEPEKINQLIKENKKSSLYLTWKNLKLQKEFDTLFPLAWQLLTFKEWVIKRTKEYLKNYELPDLFPLVKDKLSLAYDNVSLTSPYSYRVLSSLVKNNGKTNIFHSDKFWQNISKEKETIFSNNLKEKLISEGIHGLPLVSLIIDESINQGIRSLGGTDYHERVKFVFDKLTNWQLINEKKIDSKNSGIEYDLIYSYKNKKIGISAKRTLRERYKQNWDNTKNLEVDIMLLVTLGTDLNEGKMKTVLEKQGWYIIVAKEIYEKHNYLSNNPKVFASSQVVNDFIEKGFEIEKKKLK